jgi:predicted DNA-binding transcriptional regulator YafY
LDRTERFYKITQLLEARRVVPLSILIEDLGVSRATVKRDLEYLRDRLHAPIVWDRERRGYRYDGEVVGASSYNLPGMWFNASEIHALLTMERLLSDLQPGLLGPHIEPLRTRIKALLDEGDHSVEEVTRRIRILHIAARPVAPALFEPIASAVLKRRRLELEHENRKTGETTRREVSPQRLVYYRDNWYMDAWCHWRDDVRIFGLNAIKAVAPVDARAKAVGDRKLDAVLAAGYGIFAGSKTQMAKLRFSPERSRWVAHEQWHPEQEGRFDIQGRYVLSFPYSNETELLMDILRHGPEVEVLAPSSLRARLQEQAAAIAALYAD